MSFYPMTISTYSVCQSMAELSIFRCVPMLFIYYCFLSDYAYFICLKENLTEEHITITITINEVCYKDPKTMI